MKIAITSNIVIDFVHNVKGMISKSLSGPACYCGITARQFGFEVCLATKIGTDFCACHMQFLHDLEIVIKKHQITEYPTMEFKVKLNDDNSRHLYLLSKCGSLTEEDIHKINADCWLVSPVQTKFLTMYSKQ